jgi:CMP-N,N'-diacetyllegionaminic acid synthase
MRIDAVILARGGSKGIPNKNIIDFCGKPLLAWTILQAHATKAITDVWVSSDSQQIINIAAKYGAKSVIRPENISGDKDTSESAWLHAINEIKKITEESNDYIITPQVTSPLRGKDDLALGIENIIKNEADSLLSVVEIEDHFIWEKDENKKLISVNYDYNDRKPRQQIKKRYLENGSFYITKPEILINYNNRLGGNIAIHIMEQYKMFQIDNIEDVKLCSVIMRGYQLDKI